MKNKKYLLVYDSWFGTRCTTQNKKPTSGEKAKADMVISIPDGVCLKNKYGKVSVK